MSAPQPDHQPHPLAVVFDAADFVHCDVGPINEHWVPFSALGDLPAAGLESVLALQARNYPGLDRRGQAAFVLGALSYNLVLALAMLHLSDAPWPALDSPNIAVRLGPDPEDAHAPPLLLRINEEAPLTSLTADQHLQHVPECLQALLEPFVSRLRAGTRLSFAAQWRLVGDSLAGGLLFAGKQLNQVSRATADARAMLAEGRSLLSNPQVGYHVVEIEKQNGVHCETFLSRGGCCRYYTADAGGICATCVLRDPGDQWQRLQAHLIESLEQ